MKFRDVLFGSAVAAAVTLAACGGSTSPGAPIAPPNEATNPPATNPPATNPPGTSPPAQPQVVSLALPESSIGSTTDLAGDEIAGFTQSTFSQALGFVTGSQIMIRNGQSNGTPHTLGDTGGTTGFPTGQPAALSFQSNTANGGNFGPGFQTGTITSGTPVGPFTLATAGTYYIGCAYHYSDALHMRDILVVSANAAPGPQATPLPGATPPPAGPGGPGY